MTTQTKRYLRIMAHRSISIVAAICATILIICDKDVGWGWLIFLAVVAA